MVRNYSFQHLATGGSEADRSIILRIGPQPFLEDGGNDRALPLTGDDASVETCDENLENRRYHRRAGLQ